jgi:hypothetical protein
LETLRWRWEAAHEEHIGRRAPIAEVEEAIFRERPHYRRGREGTSLAVNEIAA